MRTYDVPLQNIKPGLQTQQLLNRYDPDKLNEMAKKFDEGVRRNLSFSTRRSRKFEMTLLDSWGRNNLDGKRPRQQS